MTRRKGPGASSDSVQRLQLHPFRYISLRILKPVNLQEGAALGLSPFH